MLPSNLLNTSSHNVTTRLLSDHYAAPTVRVPNLPPHLIPRMEDARIKEMVLAGKFKTIVITDPTGLTFQGSSQIGKTGSGKSVLAMVLAHDSQIQQAFSDGIMWLTLGQHPALTILQFQLAGAFQSSPIFEDIAVGVAWISTLMKDKACLLILDDVYSYEHVAAFTVLGPKGCLVLTTRDSQRLITPSTINHGVVKSTPKKSSSRPIHIDTFPPDHGILALEILTANQALTLLAAWAEQPVTELPPAALDIAHECENLPLALTMLGSLAAVDSWDQVLCQIRKIDPDLLRRKFADNPAFAPRTLRALQVAINSLEPDIHRRYLDLAIFPANIPIPLTILQALWAPELEINVDIIVTQFEKYGLVQRDHNGHLRLHEIQQVYLQKQTVNRSGLHARLLHNAAIKFLAPSSGMLASWYTLSSNETYLWQYLPYHLIHAGHKAELVKLFTDFNWLYAQLKMLDIPSIRAAYTLLPSEESLNRIREVLRLATPALSKDITQLASQLLGRLLGLRGTGLRGLIKQAMRWKEVPWLRPLTDSLIASVGPLEHTLVNPQERMQSLAISPDGRQLIAASIEGRIKVWDLEQWLELYTLTSQHYAINAVAILNDGQRLILGADDGILELWDLDHREVLCTLKGHKSRINAVVVMQNGRQALSASADGTLKGWNLEQRSLIYTLKASGPVRAVAIFADGVHAISGSDNGIQLWDLVHRIEKRTFAGHQAPISAVAVTPDGRKIISGSLDTTIKVWNIEQGAVIHTLKGHTGPIRALALTPDGQWIISASIDGTLKIWDLERGIEHCTLPDHRAEVWAVTVTWDGRAISAGADRTLKVWDLERGADLHTMTGHRDAVNAVAILPGGTQIISASDDRTLKIWSMKWRKAALHTLVGHTRDVSAVAVSTDGRRAISASKDKTLKIWDLEHDKEQQTLTGHGAPVRTVILTTDGRWAISGSSDRTVRVWDLEQGNAGHALTGHHGAVTAVALVREGDELLSASLDGTIKLWDWRQGTELPGLVEELGTTVAILTLATIADTPWVIAGADDGTLQIWPTIPGGKRYIWHAHQSSITALAITTDGQRVISGSSDHTIRVWDLPNGKTLAGLTTKNLHPHRPATHYMEEPVCIAEFTGESAILTCVVAADGVTIIAGEKSGRIHFLRLEL